MIHLSEQLIAEIKGANDILEVAGEHFTLNKMGNIYQAHCPGEAHEKGDKTASLTFFPDTQSFYCFGCGAGSRGGKTEGSDVIAFIMWMEKCSWPQAAMKLANRRNIRIPTKEMSKEEREKQKKLEETNERNKMYWRSLQENKPMIQYLLDRGFTEDDITKWRLGWVPYTDPTRAAGRLVFAVMNDWGQTVGFSYRNMEEYFPRPQMPDTGPKYFNSPTSSLFNKGTILYGLHSIKKLIREKDYIIITEGFADCILAQRYGLPAVSIMGTSLTDEHIKMIGRYTKNVYIWLDGDPSGLGAALRHLDPLRSEGYLVKVVHTPGQDPDDVVQEHRDHIEEHIMNIARLAGDFEIQLYMGRYKSDLTELKLKTIRGLVPIFKRIGSRVEYEIYAAQVADDLGITTETLLAEVERE